MQKIWLLLEEQSVFVYVIAGLCVFGVLTKLLLQGKLHRLLKASEDMASTKERQMRTIRNHYENNLNMDIQINHIGAFVEKYISKLKYGGIPIRIWDSLTLEMAMLTVAAGGLGIINTLYRGYDEIVIVEILVATILGSVILLTVENIFRLEDAYDRLSANVEDYLDNNLRSRLGRPIISRQERAQRQQDELVAVANEITGHMAKKENEDNQGQRKQREKMVDRTQTDTGGRANTRPRSNQYEKEVREGEYKTQKDGAEDIPEYEIRRKATRNHAQDMSYSHSEDSHMLEAAAGEEDSEYDAAVISEVLRSFFSG